MFHLKQLVTYIYKKRCEFNIISGRLERLFFCVHETKKTTEINQ